MLVYQEMANDLHRELSRIEKNCHFFCLRALITHCTCWSRVKFCAVGMRNARLRNHLKEFEKHLLHPCLLLSSSDKFFHGYIYFNNMIIKVHLVCSYSY